MSLHQSSQAQPHHLTPVEDISGSDLASATSDGKTQRGESACDDADDNNGAPGVVGKRFCPDYSHSRMFCLAKEGKEVEGGQGTLRR